MSGVYSLTEQIARTGKGLSRAKTWQNLAGIPGSARMPVLLCGV